MTIIPTILAYDGDDFTKQYNAVEDLSDSIQIDIADSSFGQETVALEKVDMPANKKIIFHLMVKKPDEYIAKLLPYKPHRIIIHAESQYNWSDIIVKIPRDILGLAINPETNLDIVSDKLAAISELLIMTVEPGKQGREFDEKQLAKIKYIKSKNVSALASADGGINADNISDVKAAGADIAYVGSVLTGDNPSGEYQKLISIISQ